MSNADFEYLNNRIAGLQGVVTALMTHLILKEVTNRDGVVLALDAFAMLTDLQGEQLAVFESVKRTLLAQGVWIPQVIEGGKSEAQDPEAE